MKNQWAYAIIERTEPSEQLLDLGSNLVVVVGGGGGVGVVLLRILSGVVPPSSPNPDPIADQKNVIFQTHFQAWPSNSIPIIRPQAFKKLCHHYFA